jgi:hypothetical protein
MKRFGIVLAWALLGSMIVGCENGIPEGSPKEPVTGGQTPQFKALMEKNGGEMTKTVKPPKSKS